MLSQDILIEKVEMKNEPNIPGLNFRRFRGEEDYPVMVEIINAAKDEDQLERTDTVEDITNGYEHLDNCNPYTDMIFAEVDGEPVAYSRCWWGEELNGDHIYGHFVFMKPAWRGQGIGQAISDEQMERLRIICQRHPAEAPKYYQMWAASTEKWATKLIKGQGFEPVRFSFEMTRPCSRSLRVTPLPVGIEVRPVKPEQYRKVWEAEGEAFRDHWGYQTPTEEDYKAWLEGRLFDPELWMVAWDGDEVAGMVLNYLDEMENEEYERQRGYTENISVRRPWRRMGVARALLTRSIRMFQEMGMEETCLGVDTENPSGALNLYESVGYREVKRYTGYRKPFN